MIHKKPFQLLWIIGMILLGISNKGFSQILWSPSHSIGTITGKYNFSYTQTPDQLVELQPAWISLPGGGGYQWEQSTIPAVSGFAAISGATATSYTVPGPFTQDMWFRRKTYSITNSSIYIYSNIIKISIVSVNWEDINYVREHDVITTNITDWQTVDQLTIGQKLQTTTYLDGLGRSVEKVSRETATPAVSNGSWGDQVQFSQYDALGREPVRYLPYTTTTQTGKFKTTQSTEQPQYYTTTYNETSAFSTLVFDNSPLNRVVNVKEPGTAWASATGNAAAYDMNSTADNVQQFSVDYIQGDAPVDHGAYPANTLHKLTYTDENQKQVVEYMDKSGKLILKKVQVDPSPTAAHAGWICTYSVYDDLGLLRYQIQPEGVKYLDGNSWSFAGTEGAQVLTEQVFQYYYDDKGRTTWKKAPGAAPLNMIYDSRDRLVFTQDGNQQLKSPGEWTATLYDNLDRPTLTMLYETGESAASLQADISNAITDTTSNTFTSQPNAIVDYPVYTRDPNVAKYSASNSIAFYPDNNFTSGVNDQFVAEIDPITVTNLPATVTTFSLGNPISSSSLVNSSVTTILKYYFYDNYSFANVKAFDNSFTNQLAYSTSDPNVLPIATSLRTSSMLTGSLTRVLGTNTFLASTQYYDEKGRPIQGLEDNIKGGVDISTLQHHFDGRILSSCLNHSAPGTGYTGFITLSMYIFDKLGRVTSIRKQYGGNAFKTISSYDYDDVGRVKTKHLDPNYNNPNSGLPDLESLKYSFNIHNQITGINKDFALKTPATYNKWGHFFGLYLGYDNRDNVFASAQLNGQVTGQQWNTQGDDAQRKYDYTYDNAGRLINAVFNEQQHPGDGWSSSKMDFSVSGFGGQISYDLNGNLLTMLQKGVTPGTPTPITVDDLRYVYNAHSNKLQSVTDQMTVTTVNGQFGDFKDGANAAGTADYVYDANGNLVIDLNKNVQTLSNGTNTPNGISYNFLDKPDQIRVVGKGTIKIVYNADGEKLQRVFIPESGGLSTVTTYIDEFVYQGQATLTLSSPAPFLAGATDALSYINFEDGRIRVMTPPGSPGNSLDGLTESGNITLPNSQMGVWDYFIMDYQKNVRMVLTEETHNAFNTCTMELTQNRPVAEDPVFGQTGSGNEVEATRYNTPTGWQSVNSSASVSRLGNLAGYNIGPNTLQKVMAGDQVTATAQYYYQGAVTNSNPNIIPNILNSLAAAIGGNATASTIVHGNAANITGQLSGSSGFIGAVEPTGAGGSTPQAYLTILFFDERFNLIPAADGGVAQQQVASSWTTTTPPLGLGGIRAPKNGYVYVYVSNRSDQDVYFDNMVVGIQAGNIIEENHYYAFGLKIAGISSKKLGDMGEGTLKNSYLYNDKELFDDGDLNWYDYGFRSYDPQIGRFTQLDPLTDDYPELTPYQFAGNDPVANVDLDGLEPLSAISKVAESGGSVLFGTAGNTAELVNAGTASAHWVSNLAEATVVFKLPAKAAVSVLKPVITATLRITVQASTLVDNVVIGKPSPVQDPTLEQKKKLSLVIHDKLNPAHPLIEGNYIEGAKDHLLGDEKRGYAWGWRIQGIQEDEGFWLGFMPMPKIFTLLKGVGRTAEVVAGEGTEIAARSALTDVQILTKVAQKAERAIGGKGAVAGTLKHTYANNLIRRYQSIFGDRGLEVNFYFNNGPGNRGFLDVINRQTQSIFDFKFGDAIMSTEQFSKYIRSFPGYSIQIIKP